jgi:hypothetical protein
MANPKGNSRSAKFYQKNKAARDKKKRYDSKFQKSDKQVKKRVEANRYNRQNGTYGNGDGKDASHNGGKVTGLESQKTNRGKSNKNLKSRKAKRNTKK